MLAAREFKFGFFGLCCVVLWGLGALGFRLWGLGFGVSGFGLRVEGLVP